MEGRFPDGSKIVKIEWSKRKKAVGRLSGVGAECSRVSRADRDRLQEIPGDEPRSKVIADLRSRAARRNGIKPLPLRRLGAGAHGWPGRISAAATVNVSTVGVAGPTRIPGPEIDSLSQPFFPLPRDSARR